MKCNNCGNEVSKGFDDLLCPVCGQRIVFEKLFDLVSYVVEHKGISIVSKHKVFISLLRDYAPNLNKEIRLIQIAVESGTYDELIAVDGTSDFQKTMQKNL